jgi:beta-lactamase regulating signal transducer with metallopeptidase domain
MMQRALIEYIVNALWQIPLLAGAAWLLLRAIKPGPRTQHRVWLAVLGLAVLLPIEGMGRISTFTTAPQPAAVVARESAAAGEIPIGALPHVAPPHDVSPTIDRERTHWLALDRRLLPRTHTIRLSETYARWLVRFYLVAVSLAMLRIARGWNGARVLVARSRETIRHRAALANYSLRFKIKTPQLRESGEVSSPMILGVTRPVLLLPEGFEQFTEEEIGAALCHELAHIKRRDYLVNAVCQLVALPVVWHPILHAVQQRIRMTREMVCDAMAAEEMESEIGYAKCLLALAQSMLGTRGRTAHPEFLGLFSHNTLEERVMELVETTTVGMRARVARMTSGAAVMIASFVVAAAFHVTPTMAESSAGAPLQVVQDAPASQTPPAVPAPERSATSPVTQSEKESAIPEKRGDVHRNDAAEKRKELTPVEQTATADELKEQIEDAEGQAADAKEFSPAECARIARELKEQIEDAQRRALNATGMLNSPEFKKQMEDVQRQAANAKDILNSSDFKKQMEDVQRQAANAKDMLNSSDFKKQMEDFQRQAANQKDMLNSPEFKRQMEDFQRQAANAKDMLNSPEFKKQMEDFQRQAANAKDMLNGPESKKQMEDLQRQAANAKDMLNSPESKKQMEDVKRQMEDLQKKLQDGELPRSIEQLGPADTFSPTP